MNQDELGRWNEILRKLAREIEYALEEIEHFENVINESESQEKRDVYQLWVEHEQDKRKTLEVQSGRIEAHIKKYMPQDLPMVMASDD